MYTRFYWYSVVFPDKSYPILSQSTLYKSAWLGPRDKCVIMKEECNYRDYFWSEKKQTQPK